MLWPHYFWDDLASIEWGNPDQDGDYISTKDTLFMGILALQMKKGA